MLTKMILSAAILAIALPASAQTPEDVPSHIKVLYGDLDLSTQSGVAALNSRVRSAAKKLCPPDPGRESTLGHAIFERCLSDTILSSSAGIALAISSARAVHPAAELATR